MEMAAGDEHVAMEHRKSLRNTLIATGGAMGIAGVVHFFVPLLGTGGSVANAPQLVGGVYTLIHDMTGWLIGLVPAGGSLVAAYHWFMSGPGSE